MVSKVQCLLQGTKLNFLVYRNIIFWFNRNQSVFFFEIIFTIFLYGYDNEEFIQCVTFNRKTRLSVGYQQGRTSGGARYAVAYLLKLLSKNNIMAKLFISFFTKLRFKYYLNFPNTEISLLY